MPHVRLFAFQFALCLLALILLGAGFTDVPGLVIPVLTHLTALICAGYVARPNRTLGSQYFMLGLTAFSFVVWIVYAFVYAYGADLPRINVVYAGFIFYIWSAILTIYITKEFKSEQAAVEPIQEAVPGFA